MKTILTLIICIIGFAILMGILSTVGTLLTAPSTAANIVAILVICALVIVGYYIYKLIKKLNNEKSI